MSTIIELFYAAAYAGIVPLVVPIVDDDGSPGAFIVGAEIGSAQLPYAAHPTNPKVRAAYAIRAMREARRLAKQRGLTPA